MRSRPTSVSVFLPVAALCFALGCASSRIAGDGATNVAMTAEPRATASAHAPIAPRAARVAPIAERVAAPIAAPAAATERVAATPVDRAAEVQSLIALGKSDNRVMEHLDHLSNRIGPRLTGSHRFRIACEWAREQLESFGLANARLEAWGEFPVGFDRGPSFGRMTKPTESALHFATNAWTAGTRGPVQGRVVMAPTNDAELERVRASLAGAWVLAPSAAPRERGGERRGDAPQATAAPATERSSSGASTSTSTAADGSASTDAPRREPAAARADASEAGAGRESRAPGTNRGAGAPDRAFREKLEKVYDEAGVAGVIRSGRGELLLTGGNHRVKYDALPTRASITLLAAEFDAIRAKVEGGEEVELEFEIRNWFEKGPIELHNVIAEIPGTERPDEVVVVGGHLDTWDGATGATDNGTGVATTMEAARLLVKSGARPKRTIRFMLFGGEEQGLLGSAAYVKAHAGEMEKISAVLVHDGGTNYCGGITATPPMMEPLTAVFAPVVDLDPELPFRVREVKGLSSGGSDHASFLAANVPGFFWSQRGRANYNDTHHTQFDTYEQAIPEYQRNSAIVIAVGALGIANLPELLSRENLRAAGGGGGGRRLGVQLGDEMTIEEVVEGGLARKAGLRAGDKLVKIAGRPIADRDEMRSALASGPAKTTVTVLRDAKEIEVELEFAPEDPSVALARRLGARLGDATTVDVVTPGGAGDQAGLQAGDRIVRIDDKAVRTIADAVASLPAQRGALELVVLRDGKEVKLTIKP